MTRQVLNRGTIANDGTGDTLRTATLKIEQNFEEIYQKLGDGSSLMPLIDFDSSGIIFEGTTQDNFETRLQVANPTADNTVTIPNYSGALVMDSATQTLSNKTILSPTLTTPQINDAASNHQYVLAVNNLAANRTITLPLLGAADTFVFNNHTATLKNKTLQNPTINSAIIGSQFLDSAGNELISFQDSASAVNFLRIGNSPTNQPVRLQAAGEANSTLSLRGTGNGGVAVDSKLVLKTQTISATGGSVNTNVPVTVLTATTGTPVHTIPNGTTGANGEVKYIVNKGTVTNTVNETANNIINGTTLTINAYGAVTLMWFGSQWIVINTYNATLT